MTLHLFGAPRSPCGNDEGPFSITLEGTTCVDCLRASALAGVAQIHGLEAALTALRAERDKWQSLLPAGLVEQNKHLERQLRIEIDNAQRAEAALAEARARLAVPPQDQDLTRWNIWGDNDNCRAPDAFGDWVKFSDVEGRLALPPPPAAEGETPGREVKSTPLTRTYDHDFGNPRNMNELGTGNIK